MTNEIRNVPELRFPEFEDEWKQKRLGEVAEIIGGGTPSTSNPQYWGGDINWYSPIEIGENIYLNESKNKITKMGLKKSSAKILPIGSVLFTSRAGIGNTAILKKEAATNQGFKSIVPKDNKLDTYFIFSRTNELKKYGEINGAGSTFVEVSGKEMEKMPMLFPEISEQQKIGNFFSKLDRQIELEEQKLAKLEEQKKGYMQKIFSQELRFKDESGNEYPEWEEKKLFNVVKYLSSKRSSNYYSEDIIHGQYPVYDAVQEISRDTNFDIEESYISILKDGAGVGRLNLRPGKSSVIGTMGYLLPQNIDIKFLFYYLKTMNFNRFIIGSTIPHLYFKDYSKETILIPIDKSEQIKIGSFFIKLDSIINNKAKKIKVLKQRKQGFLQKMFI
ncbi:restriction endonuclease subunit S [Staphylococcus sp. IVB6227]|uniref:restriction endonuclease subunit S n=1 Tax=Staphylococcus sp. IVB6227 TaxID=2989768 RepID=UPI0021CEDBE7|nr:restriction endonuclease subunit S [Staphylococcus sp. IVB6227]UXR78399.1 restriction endonuclease subunit S [Staphylococcus sp. IVB6227]